MPRTTKSVTAKAKHKKVLSATKGIMVLEVDYLELPSSLISSLYNMLLEIERIRKEHLGHFG